MALLRPGRLEKTGKIYSEISTKIREYSPHHSAIGDTHNYENPSIHTEEAVILETLIITKVLLTMPRSHTTK